MVQGYLIFHLNLAFSSISTDTRPDVIRKCYWPLLELIEETGIPVGIELTGWTLQQIVELDFAWVERFCKLLNQGQCELIGSGWSQIIGPLVPYTMNCWNQKLGLEAYQKTLGITPNIALINEMAFSSSMVDIYVDAGYEGIVMDRDNVRLALGLANEKISTTPTHALGCGDISIPVLWSDSILFQRLQRVVHGDIGFSEYMAYVKQRTDEGDTILPVYCNDAEVFDFRPGRYSVESNMHLEGEWSRLKRVCNKLHDDLKLKWLSPSEALAIHKNITNPNIRRITSVSQPIPVKKQAKYNINRWAVTGRDDLWLNTACHQIYQALAQRQSEDIGYWRELCELWASDLRTHITSERWGTTVESVFRLKHSLNLKKHNARDLKAVRYSQKKLSDSSLPNGVHIEQDEEGILWTIKTAHSNVVLNIRRGLAIKTLAFKSHNFKPVLGTLSQGYFRSIELGADFYTGGVIIEIPEERVRVTDLEWVNPQVECKDNKISILANFTLGQIKFRKIIVIDTEVERIRIKYDFGLWQKTLGTVRVGIMTFLPESFLMPYEIFCKNGGNENEYFTLRTSFNHGQAASTLVSSSAAFGATDGRVLIADTAGHKLQFIWDPAACAATPMFQHKTEDDKNLSRLYFSLCELDDTSKPGGKIPPFCLEIRAS